MNQVNLYINTKETRSNFIIISIKIIPYSQQFQFAKEIFINEYNNINYLNSFFINNILTK